MRCPYSDCPFEGSEAEVDDHVHYMTTVVKDRDHEEDRLKDVRWR